MSDLERMAAVRPLIAVTMGDPAGIGPEICCKALSREDVNRICRSVLVGDMAGIGPALPLGGNPAVREITSPAEGDYRPGVINLMNVNADAAPYDLGVNSARGGDAAYRFIRTAIRLAAEGLADATVTAPISKEALHLAGHYFAGHTELYAHFTGAEHYSMMLAQGPMRVVHVSTHVSLREACERVTRKRVLEVITLAWDACRKLGIAAPKVAVAGLNPHCGENGLFGREELEEIIPAVEEARYRGILADGPIPADTVFSLLNGGRYDICVCMYHDQGHIPVKLLGFTWDESAGLWNTVKGVNITLGLPIIRVSVDHGTAFDIAGRGVASPESLCEALRYAVKLVKSR